MKLKRFMTDDDRMAEAYEFLCFIGGKRPIELVALYPQTKKVASGVFLDLIQMVRFARKVGNLEANVYYSISHISHWNLPYKFKIDVMYNNCHQRCSDKNVGVRNLFLIDLDPIRETGKAATIEQLRAALKVSNEIQAYLEELGWADPVVVFSGNGCHLLYRVVSDLIEEGNNARYSWLLRHIASRFPSEDTGVDIDIKVSNPSRIARLPGFLNHKAGRDAFVVSYPETFKKNSVYSLVEKLGWSPAKASDVRGLGTEEKIYRFAAQYPNHIRIDRAVEAPEQGRTYFALEICPHAGYRHEGVGGKYNCSHLILFDDGRVGFNCYKESCNCTLGELIRFLEEQTGIKNRVKLWEDAPLDLALFANVEEVPLPVANYYYGSLTADQLQKMAYSLAVGLVPRNETETQSIGETLNRKHPQELVNYIRNFMPSQFIDDAIKYYGSITHYDDVEVA
jgi:hypothetical protein